MRVRVVAVLAFLSVGVIVHGQKVSVDADSSAPFATYRTYAWTVGTPSADTLSDDRVRAAVDAQLAGKGLTQVMDAPNVFVATHVLTEQQHELVANGFRPWGWGGGTINVESYTTGAVIVDLYDAGTRKLVWRGASTATLTDKPSKNASKIDKALARMFQKYPPATLVRR